MHSGLPAPKAIGACIIMVQAPSRFYEGGFTMAYLRKRGSKWYYSIEVGTGAQRKRVERVGGRTKD